MAEIFYPIYRTYVANRIEVNDAMSALLAGSRLAAHTLQLTTGSSATLAELFPAVPHIHRFNLRSDAARGFLQNGDYHIASVAVPYALATHEDFVMATLEALIIEGFELVTGGKTIKAWNMHSVLFETCGAEEPRDLLQLFHVIRELRNCVTHAGGSVNDRLLTAIDAVDEPGRQIWRRLNDGDDPESLSLDGRVQLTAETIFSSFAVTKSLGRAINKLLVTSLTGESWANIAVRDFADLSTKTRNSSSWRRALLGYVRLRYSVAPVTDDDLERAARSAGLWTVASWQQ